MTKVAIFDYSIGLSVLCIKIPYVETGLICKVEILLSKKKKITLELL